MIEHMFRTLFLLVSVSNIIAAVDDRTEPKIPKFRCFGNFGSVRFGSVRLKNTEPKQIEEFRFNNKLKLHIGSEICKKFSSKSVHGII